MTSERGAGLRIHRGAEASRVRWRNGGGWTRELVRWPTDGNDFDWRLSVADVEVDGPFSEFAGYDRELMLLGGTGMELCFHDGGDRVVLRRPLDGVRFSGDAAVHATLVDGPTTDLNLIWRRDRCVVHSHQCLPGAPARLGGGAAESVVAYIIDGLTVGGAHAAATGDAVTTDPGVQLTVDGRCLAVAFVISPVVAS